jgi:TolB-like protein
MQAWIKSEGTRAQFNPLATTRKAEGATNFNSVGVKNFVSYEQGVDTTIGAITNGLYDDVITALRRGDDAYAVADAIAASRWGTGGLVRKVLDSNRI